MFPQKCGYSLEVLQQGFSNEYLQYICFCSEVKYLYGYSSYLELWHVLIFSKKTTSYTQQRIHIKRQALVSWRNIVSSSTVLYAASRPKAFYIWSSEYRNGYWIGETISLTLKHLKCSGLNL